MALHGFAIQHYWHREIKRRGLRGNEGAVSIAALDDIIRHAHSKKAQSVANELRGNLLNEMDKK